MKDKLLTGSCELCMQNYLLYLSIMHKKNEREILREKLNDAENIMIYIALVVSTSP